MRKNEVGKNQFGSYLLYAIGEIVLVVVGILIALSINNWNEERQHKQRVRSIFQILKDDIGNDLKDVESVLDYYDSFEDEFIDLMNGDMTFEEFAACPQCAYLVTGHRSFNIEVRGYEALKEFYSGYDEDSLVNEVVQFYTSSITDIDTNDDLIRESITSDLVLWRDKYDWFPNFARQTDNTEYARYAVSSKEFRNMTAWRYALIYTNYVPTAKTFQKGLKQILKDIESRLHAK